MYGILVSGPGDVLVMRSLFCLCGGGEEREGDISRIRAGPRAAGCHAPYETFCTRPTQSLERDSDRCRGVDLT
jgi:hypothetical protein